MGLEGTPARTEEKNIACINRCSAWHPHSVKGRRYGIGWSPDQAGTLRLLCSGEDARTNRMGPPERTGWGRRDEQDGPARTNSNRTVEGPSHCSAWHLAMLFQIPEVFP